MSWLAPREERNRNIQRDDRDQTERECHSKLMGPPTPKNPLGLVPLNRTLSISSLRDRDIALTPYNLPASKQSHHKDGMSTQSVHLRGGTPSPSLSLRPGSMGYQHGRIDHAGSIQNPKVARVRTGTSTPLSKRSMDSAVFVSQPMPVDRSCAKTATGLELYRLSHAVPSLLGSLNYILGLDALRNVTPPVLVSRDDQGNTMFDIQAIHPRDRALLLVLMYAGLPDDAKNPTVRHWLAPFAISDDKLHCWKEGDDTSEPPTSTLAPKSTPVAHPTETDIDLTTFSACLGAWQRANPDPECVSNDNDPLPAKMPTDTLERMPSPYKSGGTACPKAEPTDLYAYRFSHSKPLGELYEPGDPELQRGRKRDKRTTGTGESTAITAAQGAPSVSITKVLKTGKEAYSRSRFAGCAKPVCAVMLGLLVLGGVLAVCFFRLWDKKKGFGE